MIQKSFQSLAQHFSCRGMKGLSLLKAVKSVWDQGKNLTVHIVDANSSSDAVREAGTLFDCI